MTVSPTAALQLPSCHTLFRIAETACGSLQLPATAGQVKAVGRRALMYFHAEISSETNAAEKYPDAMITDPRGQQIRYACNKYCELLLQHIICNTCWNTCVQVLAVTPGGAE